MGKLIFAFVVIGAVLGFMVPSGQRPLPQAQPARAAAMAHATDKALDTVLERQPNGHFYVDALVNGKLVHFLVDTGASGVALTQDDARTVGITVDPTKFEIVGRGASGDVRGQRVDIHHIAIGQKEAWDLPSVVLTDMDISLLGQTYLSQIGSLTIENNRMTLR